MGSAIEPDGTTYVLYRTFKEVDEKFMMSGVFWYLVIVVIVYVVGVVKVGPDLMKGRQPFELRKIIMIYNLIQVFISLKIALTSVGPFFSFGIIPKSSPLTNPEFREAAARALVLVYMSKFGELLDTIFFVLRKKFNQISFLHVYHHASVIIGTWMVAKFGMSYTCVWGTFMNSSVHVVMYFYYFMAALGPQYQKYLTWKKYITTFQMVQFATVFAHQTLSLIYTKGEHSIVGIFYLYFSAVMFFSLFLQFYLKTYTKKKTDKVMKKIANGKSQ